MRTMKVAIIGAGPAGVAATKICIEEGLEPICFEKSNDVGGLWYYDPEVTKDRTTVMECTVANISKEMSSYSDFPPPKDFPIYLPQKLFKKYIDLYVENFKLKQYITFNKEVMEVKETDDHLQTGRWNVKVRDTKSGDISELVVDAVFVCSGVMTKAKYPDFKGQETFKGRIEHVQQYRNSSGYAGKRVLVVGFGNSAGDVACDLSTVADQVYMSTRNGGWVIPRQSKRGSPVEFMAFSRIVGFMNKAMPNLLNKIITKQCNERLDHEKYGICPQYPMRQCTSIVNDEISFKFMNGMVKVKPAISKLDGKRVEFVDGTVVEDVDVIMCATGYTAEFPFLSSDIVGKDLEQLYLTVFPRHRKTSTLALHCMVRVKGPLLPITEMQARYSTRIVKGTLSLPDEAEMLQWVQNNIKQSREHRTYSLRGVSQIDYVSYVDQLARLIGCMPSFWKLVVSDFQLAKKYLFGPVTPYQYRLHGPGAWSGARDAIMGQEDRTYYSLTDGRYKRRVNNNFSLFKGVLVFSVVSIMICWLFI